MPNANSPNQPGGGARNSGGTPYRNPVLKPGETMRERQRRLIDEAREDQRRIREEVEQERTNNQVQQTLQPLPGPSVNATTAGTLRYPNNRINADSDYVIFEFFAYAPPFGGRSGTANYTQTETTSRPGSNAQQRRKGLDRSRSPGAVTDQRTNLAATAGNYINYNQEYEKAGTDYPSIVMYMPEDVSTGFRGNWGGKAFSNIATSALQAAGAKGLNKLDNAATGLANAFESLPALAGAAVIRKGIQKITGDSLSNDDVFGAISGAILNPNTELLFNGVDMRNFQLNFKLVPHNQGEVKVINDIIKTFKMCTLPQRSPGKVFGMQNQGIVQNFIGVPNLCKVSFMKGSDPHPVLPIYKMCAVTQVDVNYTPDGTYATYRDGQPVAIQLALNFQETKLVFAEEVRDNNFR